MTPTDTTPCTDCNGSGVYVGFAWEGGPCRRCGGSKTEPTPTAANLVDVTIDVGNPLTRVCWPDVRDALHTNTASGIASGIMNAFWAAKNHIDPYYKIPLTVSETAYVESLLALAVSVHPHVDKVNAEYIDQQRFRVYWNEGVNCFGCVVDFSRGTVR